MQPNGNLQLQHPVANSGSPPTFHLTARVQQTSSSIYAAAFSSHMPPGFVAPHSHQPCHSLAELGTVPHDVYAAPFSDRLYPGWQPPHAQATLPQVTAHASAMLQLGDTRAFVGLVAQQVMALQSHVATPGTVPQQAAAPTTTNTSAVVQGPARAAASSAQRPVVARPIPMLSSHGSIAALWRLYDVGEPHIKRSSQRVLEDQYGSDWRNTRNRNDRKRWSEIKLFTEEIMRRAGRKSKI